MLLTRGGAEILVRHMEAGFLVRVNAFASAIRQTEGLTSLVDPKDIAALETVVTRQPAPGKERGWSMERVFRRFADSDLFFDLYRELSGAVHPSYETFQAHVDSRDEHRLRLNPSGAISSGHTSAQATALAAVLAVDFIERCQDQPPSPSAVEAIAIAAGLPHDLAFSDQTPELQPE